MATMQAQIVAAGFVTGATGAFAGRGATVAHPGAGIFTITTDIEIDPTQKIVSAVIQNAANGIAIVLADTDATVQIGTFNLPAALAAGPVAADFNFYFEIKKMDLV